MAQKKKPSESFEMFTCGLTGESYKWNTKRLMCKSFTKAFNALRVKINYHNIYKERQRQQRELNKEKEEKLTHVVDVNIKKIKIDDPFTFLGLRDIYDIPQRS